MRDYINIYLLAPLLAIAISIAVVANASFYGISTVDIAFLASFFSFVVVILCAHKVDFANSTSVFLIIIIVALYYLLPIFQNNANLFLVDAGDFNQYVGLSSWLTSHPISQPFPADEFYNTLYYNINDHQKYHIRLGASFLLSLFSAVSGMQVVQTFSYLTAIFLGLQALAIYVFLIVAFSKLPKRYAFIIAILYGISPTASWPGYASFIPQTLGLSFLIAIVTIFIMVIRSGEMVLPLIKKPFLLLVLGLLFFAAWSIYPEGVPLAIVFSTVFGLIFYNKSLLERKIIIPILYNIGTIFTTWILISPSSFVWGIQGFIIQLNMIPHGGYQISSPLNIFFVMALASKVPLIELIINHSTSSYVASSYTLGGLCFIGLLFLLKKSEERSISIALLVTVAIVISFVAFKYRYERYGYYYLWSSLYTWNFFKAAQYLAPFVSAIGLTGFFFLQQRLIKPFRVVLLSAFFGASSIVLYFQYEQVAERNYHYRFSQPLISYLQKLPADKRLLIDLDSQDYYTRYSIYSILSDRPFISSSDWQPDILYNKDHNNSKTNNFFRDPIGYILADDKSSFVKQFEIVSKFENFYLLKAPKEKIIVVINGNNRPSINIESGSNGLKVVE
jgi:hypothetical protein